MGLQNGDECWCGASYGSYGAASSDASCSLPCSTDTCRKCGGYKLNSIYDVADACNPNPCNPGEACLVSGTNFGCVSATLSQSKCNNDATAIVSSRGAGAPFSWSLNGALTNGSSIPLSYAAGNNQLTVQNFAGANASFAFNVSNVAVTYTTTPMGCTDPPTTYVSFFYNRPFIYNGTVVSAASVSYNQTIFAANTYVLPAGATYTYTSECGTGYSVAFSLPTPATPAAPGPVSATLNTATQRMTVTFTPPPNLSVAVTQYILSLFDGVSWRKIAIAGPGSDVTYIPGTNYTFYVQAQSCSGLGAASVQTTFFAISTPVAPLRVTALPFQTSSTQGNATVSWIAITAVGETVSFDVECAAPGLSYSICATTTNRVASIVINLGQNYTIRVRAKNIAGTYGPYSDVTSVFLAAPCSTPTALAASPMDYYARTVTLTWTGATTGCTYNVQMSAGPVSSAVASWTLVSSGGLLTSYTSPNNVEDYIYTYRVSACNSYSCSSPTAGLPVLFTAAPLPPSNLAKGPQTIGAKSANVSLTWNEVIPPAKMALPFTYTIQVSTDNATWTNSSSASSSGNGNQFVTGYVSVSLATTVFVQVVAQNANGFSVPSAAISFSVAAPPSNVPLINSLVPAYVTQYGGVVITISGLYIANGANTKCKFESTAPTSTVIVSSNFAIGGSTTTASCLVPAFPAMLNAITPNGWMVSVSNDGTTYSTPVALSVSPAPYVTDASPVWIDSRGAYYYLDGDYFEYVYCVFSLIKLTIFFSACQTTNLLFGASIIKSNFNDEGDFQELEYLLPAGSTYSPFVKVSFYCDAVLIYTGLVAYYGKCKTTILLLEL